jgi:two-component system alkaline phosphatase synthesis response regulator PhoP
VKTILVVDDEPNIVELLRLYLEQEGFAVLSAADGEAALAVAARESPDLVILDLMLPRLDGFEVTRRLRRSSDVPVLMLTARSEDVDSIVGLEIGADDYVTKPFNPRALVARVKAILRRAERAPHRVGPIEVGELRIDPGRRESLVGERRLDLRPREFDLLLALAVEPGVVLTRERLLSEVWGTDFAGETRTVDVHVAEVRRQLAGDGPAIETVRGVGYRLVAATGTAEAGRGSATANRGSPTANRGSATASGPSPGREQPAEG